MKLEVRSISFLGSGALSIEVGAQSMKDAPTEPFLDVMKVWVYVPSYNKAEAMEVVLDKALEIAKQSLK
jgi:hypothetical protein